MAVTKLETHPSQQNSNLVKRFKVKEQARIHVVAHSSCTDIIYHCHPGCHLKLTMLSFCCVARKVSIMRCTLLNISFKKLFAFFWVEFEKISNFVTTCIIRRCLHILGISKVSLVHKILNFMPQVKRR